MLKMEPVIEITANPHVISKNSDINNTPLFSKII